MSGCLKPGTSAGSFILSNAEMPVSADSATPAAQGTAGSMKTYTVVTKPDMDLSKHVNHKIEVTGTVSASKASTTPASQTSSVAAAQPAETFNVDSFKMVAMACP
jgi:hypothetical protein